MSEKEKIEILNRVDEIIKYAKYDEFYYSQALEKLHSIILDLLGL